MRRCLAQAQRLAQLHKQTKENRTVRGAKKKQKGRGREEGRKGEGVCWASSSRWTERKEAREQGTGRFHVLGCEVD